MSGQRSSFLAIYLDIDGLVRGGRQRNALGESHCDAAYPPRAPRQHSREVLEVTKWIGSFKQNNLELFFEQAGAGGDFKVAAVVADAAGQSEAATALFHADPGVQLLQPAEERPRACHPVSAFAEQFLKPRIQNHDNARVNPGSGHQKEMPAGSATGFTHQPQRDTRRLQFPKTPRRLNRIAADARFHPQHVRGSGRQHAKRRRGAHHAVDHFIYGPISAGGQHGAGSALNSPRREPSGVAGSGSRL